MLISFRRRWWIGIDEPAAKRASKLRSVPVASVTVPRLCQALRNSDPERAEGIVRRHLQRSLDLVLGAFTGPA